MQEIQLTVNKTNGLHLRMVAALIAKLQSLLQNTDVLRNIYVLHNGRKVAITSLLSLVSLKIQKGGQVTFRFEEEVQPEVLDELRNFMESSDAQEAPDMRQTDQLLIENSTAIDVVLSSLPYGIVIVNQENVITYVNAEATKLLGHSDHELLNQSAEAVIPHSRLQQVLKTGKAEIGKRQKLGNRIIITNRSPIMYENQLIGAVALFQDISTVVELSKELKEVKALKEQLDLVLRSVEELIGFFDQKGRLLYANAQLEQLMKQLRKHDKNFITSLMETAGWKQQIRTGKCVTDAIELDPHSRFIVKLHPVIVDGEYCGSVLTMNHFNEVKALMEQLNIAREHTRYLETELSKHQPLDEGFSPIVGYSGALMESLSIANKAAKTDSTVLITGESGTGKELVARAIHESSIRKNKPFIRVNCGAIPHNLVESELFGHERGAFTGAVSERRGKFELADKGTIFLDEIGDLNIDLQAKLLRVIQEREFERVGGQETIKIDVRLVAATHRDLQKMVQAGEFREDLYYRLHVIPVHLPPLRKRKEDIPLLASHFREKLNVRLGKNIKAYESGFMQALMAYEWPGNIREMQNVMERAINLCEGDTLTIKDLPDYIVQTPVHEAESCRLAESPYLREGKIRRMEEYEKEILEVAMQHYTSFNQAAKALGWTHKTVASKVRKYGLEASLGKKDQGR